MKIGILTQPLRGNYGGILQNYALQYVLREMGHIPSTIELYPWKMSYKIIIKILKRIVLRLFLNRKDIDVFWEYHHDKRIKVSCENMFEFVHEHINLIYIKKNKELSCNEYDALIVGSDQVWRPKYNRCQALMFLDFATDWHIKRLSYAASFGTEKWEFSEEETFKYKELIHKFKYVSVREKSGIELCKRYFNIDAKLVLDPTLLLDKTIYLQLCKGVGVAQKGVYYYILDPTPEKLETIKLLSKKRHEPCFSFNSKYQDWSAPDNERIQPPVEKWIMGFDHATVVVTDSFHGCVFSIIFNKEFYVFKNDVRGNTRIISLLEIFGLEDHLISSYTEIPTIKNINWNRINANRRELINQSLHFLKEALS